MSKCNLKRKIGKLKRNKYFPDLKIDKSNGVEFRRNNATVKISRAGYYNYERKVFCSDAQRCTMQAFFHITCTN